jgi:RNA polymerase sigma-70 factor (ECF subfamily)
LAFVPAEALPGVDELRSGSPDAIRRALEHLMPKVRGWLYRMLGPSGDYDDATQVALMEIARALPKFEGRASLDTHAHRIVVRVAYRFFDNPRRRESPLELVPPPADLVDPESRAASREALRRLYRCLERLPEKRRVAFLLCAVEGLSPQEAAEVEGTSALAMRSRLLHARDEVARRLGNDPFFAARRGAWDGGPARGSGEEAP